MNSPFILAILFYPNWCLHHHYRNYFSFQIGSEDIDWVEITKGKMHASPPVAVVVTMRAIIVYHDSILNYSKYSSALSLVTSQVSTILIDSSQAYQERVQVGGETGPHTQIHNQILNGYKLRRIFRY